MIAAPGFPLCAASPIRGNDGEPGVVRVATQSAALLAVVPRQGPNRTSWQGILLSDLAIALFALIGVGIRVVMMLTIQQRQQRMNRQINERLRTLIAAYKTMGGSFTGALTVDPTHLRELNRNIACNCPVFGEP